jgi:transposase InsO family protein
MGTVSDCYDNAMMELFWGSMQLEPLDTRETAYKSRDRSRGVGMDRVLVQPVQKEFQPRNAESGELRGTTPHLHHDRLTHLTLTVRATGEPQAEISDLTGANLTTPP